MLPRYQPQSQLKIFEEILDLESHKHVNISIISSWLQLNIKRGMGILPVHRLEACSTI